MKFWELLFSKKEKLSIKDKKLLIFVEEILGFKIKNLSYYKEAFTHRSLSKFTGNNLNYERLEFLGDSILDTIVAEYLFHTVPDGKEGYLTQMRSKIVNRKKLNSIGDKLNLKKYIRSDKYCLLGEDVWGNIYEALIGAIFLDYGIKNCKKFIYHTLLSKDTIENLEKQITSYKSLLLEYSQKQKFELSFNTFEEIDNQDIIIYISIVRYNQKIISKGRDTSKKRAEEQAAKCGYYLLKDSFNI